MYFKPTLKAITLATLCLSLIACKSGYNRLYTNSEPDENAPDCVSSLISSNPSANTIKAFSLISDLSCKQIKNYILSGQSLGNGNQITSNDSQKNYDTLVDEISRDINKRIAVVSIDYEKTAQYSAAELTEANDQLIKHATEYDGLVSVTWTPFNPWTVGVDPDDPLAYSSDVVIANLYDKDTTTIKSGEQEFNDRLNLVIDQLKALDNNDVPVLFAPFPEMNTSSMWYGPQSNSDLDTDFKALWSHVSAQIKAAGLTNIIWVYAPRAGTSAERVSSKWGYPNSNSIDVVAPIGYSNDLAIGNYDDYKNLDKPLGMTRFGPKSSDGEFDNTLYQAEWADKYQYLAYWIADHDSDAKIGSIYGNEKTDELLKNEKIATTETIASEEWLK